MALTEAQKRAVKRYQDKNYEFVKIRLTKEQNSIIRKQVEDSGKSMNQFIVDKLFCI